jgi:hypothetical protein
MKNAKWAKNPAFNHGLWAASQGKLLALPA